MPLDITIRVWYNGPLRTGSANLIYKCNKDTENYFIMQKLNDKIKELNSTRVYKKITPMHTLDWYVKWVSSFFILIAVACRSVTEVPVIYDVAFSFIGTIGWFAVGYLWHDRAMILLNGVLTFMLGISLLRFFFA